MDYENLLYWKMVERVPVTGGAGRGSEGSFKYAMLSIANCKSHNMFNNSSARKKHTHTPYTRKHTLAWRLIWHLGERKTCAAASTT